MLEEIAAGIVGMVIGGVVLSIVFYALAPAFTRRGAAGADIDGRIDKLKIYIDGKITNTVDEITGFVDEQKKEFVEQGLPKILELGTAAIAAAVKTDRMSQLGARGAEVKGEKRALKAAAEGVAINMIEDKVPGMGATIWGMVPDEIKKMAMDNPQMIAGIIDKFKGAGGGQGGFGAAQGGGQFNPNDWK